MQELQGKMWALSGEMRASKKGLEKFHVFPFITSIVSWGMWCLRLLLVCVRRVFVFPALFRVFFAKDYFGFLILILGCSCSVQSGLDCVIYFL